MSSPTLQEIADRAGVSRMTVSLALRDQPTVSEATRRAIHRLADEMGYRKNPLLSAWQQQVRSRKPCAYQGTLAWVNATGDEGYWNTPRGFGDYLTGARRRAETAGFRVEVVHLSRFGGALGKERPAKAVAHLLRALRARGVMGVILPMLDQRELFEADWREHAVALLGKSPLLFEQEHTGPVFHEATADLYHNFLNLWHELRRRGARRVGLVLNRAPGDHVHSVQVVCCTGLQAALAEEERVPPLVCSDLGGGRLGEFEKWLDKHRPDAVVSNCLNAYYRLRAFGLPVPERLQFALTSKLPGAESWSGLDIRRADIGAAAADLVISQLIRNERGIPACPLKLLVRAVWMPGETTRGLVPA